MNEMKMLDHASGKPPLPILKMRQWEYELIPTWAPWYLHIFLISYKNLGGGDYVKNEGFQAMDIKEMDMVLSSILCDANV